MRNSDGSHRTGLFDGALTRVMRLLDSDHSPEAILDATLVYNQLVEGVAAINGYRRWDETFRRLGKLPGLQAGVKLTQRDERRHIAYGTYLGRQILAEHPELWEFTERRWARLTSGFVGGYGSAAPVQDAAAPDFDAAELTALADRRLEALRVAVTMRPADVERADVESFVPAELASIT